MHAALAAHYEHIQDTGEKPDINMLHAAFSDRWNVEMKDEIPVRFDEGETEGAIKDSGIALLELLHRSVPAPERILHVELPFAVDIPNPMADGYLEEKLIGVMDLVVRSNGNPLIVEHKTASRRYSEHRLKYDLQPTVYKFAARSLDIESPSLQFHLFLKTKKPAIEVYPVTRTERDECEMILTCAMVLKSVREGIFFPLRDWHCDDCEYAYRCTGKGGA
jgi:CRISPR/Cas system-associated exonuclease Cas4 (RecB family)